MHVKHRRATKIPPNRLVVKIPPEPCISSGFVWLFECVRTPYDIILDITAVCCLRDGREFYSGKPGRMDEGVGKKAFRPPLAAASPSLRVPFPRAQ